mmetsp:Transcript_5276/g.20573  ORF Transcript_5276/g.20573 Transcript_5276/m.20573 type:complete len:311 (-) Transcript_5276:1071-2003(-)
MHDADVVQRGDGAQQVSHNLLRAPIRALRLVVAVARANPQRVLQRVGKSAVLQKVLQRRVALFARPDQARRPRALDFVIRPQKFRAPRRDERRARDASIDVRLGVLQLARALHRVRLLHHHRSPALQILRLEHRPETPRPQPSPSTHARRVELSLQRPPHRVRHRLIERPRHDSRLRDQIKRRRRVNRQLRLRSPVARVQRVPARSLRARLRRHRLSHPRRRVPLPRRSERSFDRDRRPRARVDDGRRRVGQRAPQLARATRLRRRHRASTRRRVGARRRRDFVLASTRRRFGRLGRRRRRRRYKRTRTR